MSSAKLSPYQAYSLATRTVGKTRQVVMLYDGAIRFMKQAKDAIRAHKIEERFRLLLKASEIVVGLRKSIDYDNGGDIAHVLERFYTGIDIRILGVNFAEDGATQCDEIIEDLKQMRDVWDNIDKTLSNVDDNVGASGNASGSGVTLSA